MSKHDVIVIGGGISGLTFAHQAARAGRSVLVLEQSARLGGCLSTHRAASGYWFELGAHTCYNSYVGLTELLDGCGLRGEVVQRAKTHMRMLDGDALVPGSNLGMLLRLFSWGELAVSMPRMFTVKKEGQTVYSYYAAVVGRKNYGNVLGPMLSAVPSQSADAFPAAMLFKTRGTRRKEYPRSFTVKGGLQTIADALARQPRIEVRAGQAVTAVEAAGAGHAVVTADGARHESAVVALATTPGPAARLLAGVAPELSAVVARVKEASVESLGFAVRAEKVAHLPASTFLVPREDVFHSVVTRDSVPDASWRGFAFHFKPGLARAAKLARATQLLKLQPGDLEDLTEQRSVLPSPVLGHEELVREVDRLTGGGRLSVTGNWFAGLSIEDCVDRSRQEWARVSALG
ncbi:MAG TPA: FAD-dependent oxidoreductase [Anaeromyxobacteraceae bacterium]|nr:FAD-dependent oxidoreductase [Anaeromyxobacteraceae bacterium]